MYKWIKLVRRWNTDVLIIASEGHSWWKAWSHMSQKLGLCRPVDGVLISLSLPAKPQLQTHKHLHTFHVSVSNFILLPETFRFITFKMINFFMVIIYILWVKKKQQTIKRNADVFPQMFGNALELFLEKLTWQTTP